MTDVFSSKKRSWIMSRVRGKNTSPEKTVRSLIHRLGYRFRLHKKDLPGKPDIVFPSRRKVIFVNGCFWHGHNCKRGNRTPKKNREYWVEKISKNVARDAKHCKELSTLGWSVLVVWECEIKNIEELSKKIENYLTIL
jgi:DNA mismatch endonuclease, patch repair protein